MYKLASSLASKVGLAKNSVRPVAFRLSSSVTAAETNGHRLIKRSPFNDLEYHRLPLFGMYNPACDVRDYFEWWSSSVPSPVYKYATAMSQAMYGEKPKALVAGAKDEDLLHGIKIAHSVVREHLERCGSLVSSYEELIQVGTVAASGDRRIGELVAKAIEEVGPEGAFIISDKVKSNNELVFDKGMSLAWGLVSPFFCTSKEEETCVLQNPYVLITNKISSIQIFDVALSLSLNINNRPLLVITYDIEMEEVAVLMQDWAYFKVKVYVAKPLEYKGYTKEDAKAIMKDLAILTGGQVVDAYFFDVYEEENSVERQQLVGSCKEVRATRNSVVILGGSGSQLDIKERCEQLRSAIELSTSDDGQLLKERLKKLSHGAAVFKVCGDSKAEVRKKIKTFRNAVEAAKAAMNVGILPGGGVALLHASTELDKLQLPHKDVKLGVQLFQHALKMPVYSIASSAGFDGLAIVNKLLEQENANLGYDPIKGEYVDMIKAGNIDPLRFIIEAMDAFVTAFKLELFRTRATSQ